MMTLIYLVKLNYLFLIYFFYFWTVLLKKVIEHCLIFWTNFRPHYFFLFFLWEKCDFGVKIFKLIFAKFIRFDCSMFPKISNCKWQFYSIWSVCLYKLVCEYVCACGLRRINKKQTVPRSPNSIFWFNILSRWYWKLFTISANF